MSDRGFCTKSRFAVHTTIPTAKLEPLADVACFKCMNFPHSSIRIIVRCSLATHSLYVVLRAFLLSYIFLIRLIPNSKLSPSQRRFLAVICRKRTLNSTFFAFPPVLLILRLLNNSDAVALSKGKITMTLTIEVIQGDDVLELVAGKSFWRRWRGRFLFRCNAVIRHRCR